MKKILLYLLLVFVASTAVFATHNRAGFITYSVVPGSSCLCYNFTIITYTKTSSPADRPNLPIQWGDATSDTAVQRIGDKIQVGTQDQDVSMNIYKTQHCFPGPGTYTISLEDPNRNQDVRNIPGSVNVPFFIETTITINPAMGCDNSPVVLNPPIDGGCVGELYIYNPNAYDPDGDSLSYVLVPCRGAGGANIVGFTEPQYTINFYLDATTGDLVWNKPRTNFTNPQDTGEWNVAILILEWRKINGEYVNIGNITLDMQINIGICQNNPPVILPMPDTCVLAGGKVFYHVYAYDPDSDGVTLWATGGPFQVANTATFPQGISGLGHVSGNFNWITNCDNVRKLPYQVTFKATDDDWHEHGSGNTPNYLSDMKSVRITVIAPAPRNLSAHASGNTITLNWNQESCPNAIGYKVYRRNSFYPDSIECPCTVGVPASTGFVFIASVNGITTVTFGDDNNGAGLDHGIKYCYFVTAVFADSSESCASNQACAQLTKDSPIITNVDVDTTDANNGVIQVTWAKPSELDTVHQYLGPYKYKIYRSHDFLGMDLHYVGTTNSSDSLCKADTTFKDIYNRPFNTLDTPWSYRIEIYNNDTLVDQSHVASSVYLNVYSTDNRLDLAWTEHVGWTDTLYSVHRQRLDNRSTWDTIGWTTLPQFSDTSLANGVERCYYITSYGHYSGSGYVYPIINKSNRRCGTPYDNIPPCSPKGLTANPDCIFHQDLITWNNPNNDCANDVLGYNIYYEPRLSAGFELIATLNSPTDTFYLYDNTKSIAGCFKVTAWDSAKNESKNPIQVCVDNCPIYTLPNIFTPNGDGFNDFFHPFPYSYVRDINIIIYDRWGMIMYKTSNPDINWDGQNTFTRKDCPDGVYYYICKVNAIHYEGIRTFVLKGFVELIREKQ